MDIKLRRLLKAKSEYYLYCIEYVTLYNKFDIKINVDMQDCMETEMRMTSGHQHEQMIAGEWCPITAIEFDKKIREHKCRKTITRKAR